MPREPDGYRQQLERLAELYPGKEVLSIQEVWFQSPISGSQTHHVRASQYQTNEFQSPISGSQTAGGF